VYLALATSHRNVYESSGIELSLVGAALWCLGFLNCFHLFASGLSVSIHYIYEYTHGTQKVILAFGVAALTLPARARDPCTLPILTTDFLATVTLQRNRDANLN
jgi:hypothetical protein